MSTVDVQLPTRFDFLRSALTDQAAIGALAPTTATLAARIAALVPPDPGLRVVELGAGTGAISAAIADRLGPGARHVAVERDARLLAAVARQAPRATRVHGDARDLVAHLHRAGLTGADVVISSLPWSNFPAELSRRILAQVCAVLGRSGTFATIAYRPDGLTPRARAFRGLLDASFAQVVRSSTTWASLPPARLLVGHGPRPGSDDA